MLAVGGDDPVILIERLQRADGDSLFAVIEMQETTNLLVAIKLGAAVFETADAQHLVEQVM